MIQPCPNGCKELHYRGITGLGAYPFERWQCPVCGREEVRPYTGTRDTIEVRN